MDKFQYSMFSGGAEGNTATQGAEPITDAVLAMAYVPIQRLGTVYSDDKALTVGTLFPDLNKPFTVEGFKC